MTVDLTSTLHIFLTQNLSDYNDKIAFLCRELRRKKLIDSTSANGGKVFIKIQDDGNKEEITPLSHLTPIISFI